MNIADSTSNPNPPALAWMKKFAFLQKTTIQRSDIFLLGISVVIGGLNSGWTGGYAGGFWVALCSVTIASTGFIMLTCCLAEMTSALPFSGGVYGFVRAFIHPLFGFVVAVFEVSMCIFYLSATVHSLALIPVQTGQMPHELVLVNCLIIYLLILVFVLLGGKAFWYFNAVIGSLILLLLLTFIFGSCSFANFGGWAIDENYHEFDGNVFMSSVPEAATVYLGIQFLPLTSAFTRKPKKDIPIVMMAVIGVSTVIAIGILVTACSQYPGIKVLGGVDYPLTYGYSRLFNLSSNAALWLNAPFAFGTAFGFTFASGRQITCMSKSGLLPVFFQEVIPFLDTPYASLIAVTLVNFLLNVITYYNESILNDLLLISTQCLLIVFISAMIGFIHFHQKYSSLERYFSSPFGQWGAYVGIAIFLMCFIGGVGFQDGNYTAITVIGVIGVTALIYFILFSGPHVFSEEEKDVLFKAYLVNANLAKKQRILKRSQVLPSRSSSATAPSRTNPIDAVMGSATRPHFSPDELESDRGIVPPPIHNPQPPDEEDKSLNVLQPEPVLHSSANGADSSEGNPNPHDPQHLSSKSFSTKVIHFLSTKLNQIAPVSEENQQLNILESGGRFIEAT